MRLSTDEHRDDRRAVETVAAAALSGMTVFDTARTYGHGEDDLGHNERLLARGLRRAGAETSARIVTKGGMTRAAGRWLPDGRAKAIRADCEASLLALDGLPIDLYLIHAPDRRVPWRTTLRALARLLDEGLVRHVGLSNVNRAQLDEALGLLPIAAVQVALGPHDDHAIRGGIVARCAGAGIRVIAHSPLGGPRRAPALLRRRELAEVAERHHATTAEVVLAWLLDLSPTVVAIPGAGRPETARSSARAASVALDDRDREVLAAAFGRPAGERASVRRRSEADVVVVMGIPGAGKSRLAKRYVARGYARLNRDERGGSLRALAGALHAELSSGAGRVVLDNTYLTRASRNDVVEVASRLGAPTRCVWVDTPLAQAQVNLVERLLDRLGTLPTPEELKELARSEPGLLTPTSQMRAARDLEPPSDDEGFASVERVPFARAPAASGSRAAVFVAAGAVRRPGFAAALDPDLATAPHLVLDWSPHGSVDALEGAASTLARLVPGPVELALCGHGAGAPTCWCRPPLPGLPLAFARAHQADPSRSLLVGTGPAHRTLATALGARCVLV